LHSLRLAERGYLPMDSKAVDEDGQTLLRGHLAKTFEQDENKRGLLIVDAGIVAHDDEIDEDIDVGDFVRVEWRHMRVCRRDHVSTLSNQLQDAANLEDLKSVE